MKLSFEHPKGVTHVLVKYPDVIKALKDGTCTEAEARLTAWRFRPTWSRNKPFKLPANDTDAIAAAKDILRGRDKEPILFAAWQQERETKKGITLGDLAEKWFEAGLPYSKTEPRRAGPAAALQTTVNRALVWWRNKPVTAIKRSHHDDYVVYRRANNKYKAKGKTAGSRSADMEMSALSSLCQWAVREDLINANPFADRQRYRDAGDVQHCHQFRPDTDEELHRILRWFFTTEAQQEECGNRHKAEHITLLHRLAGGWLAFTALTGLRPEEPAYIQRGETLTQPPAKPAALPIGTIFPDRDGKLRMKVKRTKHGQNPFVDVHPVLADFLKVWTAWLDTRDEFKLKPGPDGKVVQTVRHLFPSPTDPSKSVYPLTGDALKGFDVDTTALNRRLVKCCTALKLEPRRPKGVGRAYYVAVRRSAGADDATIASELGQTTNGELIRTTYGDPDDLRGGNLRDWKPEAPATFAWTALADTKQQNIVTVKFGT